MMEQNNGTIFVDGSGRELPILRAFERSSAVFWVGANHPYTDMYFVVGNDTKTDWLGSVKGIYHPDCRMFEFYVNGANFTGHYETAYRVVASDDRGHRTVCGEGVLRVMGSKIGTNGIDGELALIYFAEDDSWRRIMMSYDSTGNKVYEVLHSKVEVPDGYDKSKVLYAYDKAESKYYAVSGFIDDAGMPSLEVAEVPSNEGKDCFVYDDELGMFVRITAVTDSSDCKTLDTPSDVRMM